MTGTQYIVDERGEKSAVVIDLNKNRQAWEDFHGLLLVRERADEPRDSVEEVRRRPTEAGKLEPTRVRRPSSTA